MPRSIPSARQRSGAGLLLACLLLTACAQSPSAAAACADNTTDCDGPALAGLAPWNARMEAAVLARTAALRARDDARSQLAAALLLATVLHEPDAPSLPDWDRPGAREAFARARALAPDDALLAWVETSACPEPCDRPALRQRLQRLEPDNAAVWLLALQADHQAGDEAAARVHLARAARSTRHTFHLEELGMLLHDALVGLPVAAPSPRELQLLELPPTGTADDVGATLAFGYASVVIPPFGALRQTCLDQQHRPIEHLRADCQAVATRLARAPDLISQIIGAGMMAALTQGTTDHAQWQAAGRRLSWLHTQAAPLTPMSDAYFRGVWRNGEVAALQRLLREAGIPLDPPAGWDPDAEPSRPTPDV